MFLRRTTQKDELGRKYHTFKLVESFRTQRGPRQRDVLNLGSSFSLPRDQWKALAQRYANEIISKQGQLYEHSEESAVETDYQTVDVNSVDSEHIRTNLRLGLILKSGKRICLVRERRYFFMI